MEINLLIDIVYCIDDGGNNTKKKTWKSIKNYKITMCINIL